MKKLIITFLLGYTFLASAQVTPFLAGRFQYTLDSVCNKYKIKGASVAVLIPGVGVWKGASGESAAGMPVTTDMLMGMGSNTKTFIAATLLKMQEQQLLSLDDTIGQWIQGYPNISGQITIRQCLNHTSGLFDYMQNGAINDSIFGNPSKQWNREEILRLALAPNSAPGAQWDYSNTNYIIAGIIIEKVLNKSPFEAINDLILAPAQLSQTFNYGEEGNTPKAHPWSLSMGGDEMTDMTETPFLDGLFSLANTAGSLITTAEDNVQFWYKLWNKEIVSEQSWKEMTQLQSLGNNDGYGLGIFMYSRKMNGRTMYSHGGTFFGYINENMVDTTSGVTIAVLTNQDSMNNNGLLGTLVRALHKVTLNMPATGIAEAAYNSNKVSFFPNPTSGLATIQSKDGEDIATCTLIDLSGKEIAVLQVENNTVNMTSVYEGLYFLQVKNEEGMVVHAQKIQIMH